MDIFKNKVVWITGATSGIGESLAIEFAKNGAKLVLSARRESELERVKAVCEGAPEIMILTLDLEKSDNFPQLAEQVSAHFGSIDFLVNNGGISQRSEAAETPLENDRRVMEINYFGNIALTKAVLPYMQKQKSGYIVTISSLSGKFGFFLRSAYSASKHALAGFYESLRLEEEKNGLKVSIVYPGFIATKISQNALNADGKAHGEFDPNQANGMPADECARVILKGIRKSKEEILVGKGELKAVWVRRFLPALFRKVIRKQSPT